MTSLTAADRRLIHSAARALAGQCDGAVRRDDTGFNGPDSTFGHTVAQLPADALSDEAAVAALAMLKKYHKQLTGLGVDLSQVAAAPTAGAQTGMRSLRTVTYEEGLLLLRFAYDVDLQQKLKAKVAGARWSQEHRCWTAPPGRLKQVTEFAEQHRFTFPPTHRAAALADPAHAAPVGYVTVDPVNEELVLKYDYSDTINRRVSALPGRRWDPRLKAWRVPAYLIRAVRRLAGEENLRLDAEAAGLPDCDPDSPQVSVVDVGDMLVVRFPSIRELRVAIMSVPGATFDHGQQAWTVPTSALADLLAAIDQAGGSLTAAAEQLRARVERLHATLALSRAVVSPTGFDVPGLARPLKEFQRPAVEYASTNRRCFVADPVGLGKSVEAIATVEALGAYPAVFIVPAGLRANWQRELAATVPHRYVVVLEGVKPKSWGMLRPEIVVIGYGVLPEEGGWTKVLADELRPLAIVCDESQNIKNPKTLRTSACIALSVGSPREGAVRLCLSGTPVENDRSEYYAQLQFLGRADEFGEDPASLRRIGDLNKRLRSAGCFVRRRKEQVPELAELPPPVFHTKVIGRADLDGPLMAEYAHAERKLLDYLAERARAFALADGLDLEAADDAALMARMRASGAEYLIRVGVLKRLAARAKLAAAKRWIQETFFAEGKPVLVFSVHLQIVDAIGAEFDAPTIQGSQSADHRLAVVDRFQAGEVKVVSLQIAAGGVGLTMTAAHDGALMEQGWTPSSHDQAFGRFYGRLNDPHGGTMHTVIAEGTIDEDIAILIEEKRVEVNDATDGPVEGEDSTEEGDAAGSQSVFGDLIVGLTRRALGHQAR